MTDFENTKEKLPSKETFYSSLTAKKIRDKGYEHVLKVWNIFEVKTMKDYPDLHAIFYCYLMCLENLKQ